MEGTLTSGIKYAMGTSQIVVDSSNTSSLCYIHASGLNFKPRVVVAIRSETASAYSANMAEIAIGIASGHPLLTNTDRVANKDYYFWSNKTVGKIGSYNAGELVPNKFFQMGANSFRLPINNTYKPASGLEKAVFYWVAYP